MEAIFKEILISNCPSLVLTIAEFFIYSVVLTLSFKYLGKCGIYIFTVLVFILSNIQVLRETQYFFQSEPVALGTTAFSMVFLANNILVEKFGIAEAKKNIYTTFCAYFIFNAMVIVTLCYEPKTDHLYKSLESIFVNSPRLFFAGVISYFIGQFLDVYAFNLIKKYNTKLLWLRNILATAISALIDNTIFSLLAWRILASDPVSWNALIYTYILGTYWFRMAICILTTPVIYFLSRKNSEAYKDGMAESK